MKAVLLMGVALSLVLLAMSAETLARATSVQRCQRRVRANCQANARICVQIARSNLCELRNNGCKQRLANCRNNNNNTLSQPFYQRVNLSLCAGMSINQRTACSSRSSNNNSSTQIIYA